MPVTSPVPVSTAPTPAPATPLVRGTKTALLAAPGWQVWGALLIVYVVWGSTYLGIRIVVETMPAIKGATATNQTKPATLETGYVV